MRLISCALLSFFACCAALQAAPAEPGTAADLAATGTWVVTFEPPGLVERVVAAPYLARKASVNGRTLDVTGKAARGLRDDIGAERARLLQSASRLLGREMEPLHVYELALNGVALTLSGREALALAAMPGIGRVEPERVYHLQTDLSAAWLGATSVWTAPAPFGNRGEGIVVGVVDTGLNRQHPSFAGVGPVDGFVHANPHGKVYGRCVAAPTKCNGKVIGIYDYSDEGLLDGLDQSNHGTLVAGIAVGNTVDVTFGGKLTRISGIAPHASMISYKACFAANSGNCPLSDVIAALEQAIEDGVDVVNLSLGYGPSDPWVCLESECVGAPWDVLNEVMLNVHAAGIVGVTGASNAGPTASSILAPGVSPWVLTIASSRHDRLPARANELAPSSGRGPALGGGYLIPDVTAPGVDILGPGAGPAPIVGGGTSLAAPQVAGAAVLLRSANPDWTVADVASALVTTARPVIVLPNGAPAGLFEQGAGLVDVSRALQAGLSLRIDSNGYRAANPYLGGDIEAMNEPALILEQCFATCSVTRTFTALASGTWEVMPEIASGVTVSASPAQFTLAAGQTREVIFSVNAESRVGEWTYGAVRLRRTDATAPDTRLPLAVFGDPGTVPVDIVIQADSDAGFRDITLGGIARLPDATFTTSALVEAFTRAEPLPKAPTGNPFNANAGGADGAFAHFITIPANSGALTLKVDTLETAALNLNLYAGRDVNANGKTEQLETECASTEGGNREVCLLEVPNRSTDERYWFVVNSREASAPGATDLVTVRWSLLGPGLGLADALTVTGPGHVESGEPFSVRVAWKDFTLTPGSERQATLSIGATPDQPGKIGQISLRLVRSAGTATAPAGLVPGQALKLRLQPGEAEDRLYVDVPPNASALTVKLAGSGEVNVYAAHEANATGPAILPAPARNLAAASSSAGGANDTLTVSGPQLQPGRWYLTPVNGGTEPATFTLETTLAYGGARAEPRPGAYYNPARSGSGAFLYRVGNAWAFAVYTYLQDGTPTWYLGANLLPGAQEGTWTVPLERFTWDGAQASGKRIGEAVLALRSPTQFQFTWNIDGESGSETYGFLDGGGCPAGVSSTATGIWSAPVLPGYGYTVLVYPNVTSIAAYFYDARGRARWALGADGGVQSGTMAMRQYLGTAPLMPYQAPVAQDIGTLARNFTTPTTGTADLDVQLAAPLTGGWTTDHALKRLTDEMGCN